jgi:hypothetical protein
MPKQLKFSRRRAEDEWVENRAIPLQKQVEEPGKHIGCIINASLHKKFKAKVSSEGENITSKLIELIEKYCDD